MTNALEYGGVIRGLMVAALRGMPTLMALLETEPENIVEYTDRDGGDLFSNVIRMKAPQIMVAYHGFRPAGGQMNMLAEVFSLYFKAKPPMTADGLCHAMLYGMTEASGFSLEVPFINLQLHPLYEPMARPMFERKQIAIDENSNYDYWELSTYFVGRGSR